MLNTTAHSRTLHSGNISRNEWPHGYKIDKKKHDFWLLVKWPNTKVKVAMAKSAKI